MNKKTLVFGSFIAVFLLIIMPNISAVEYTSMKSEVTSFSMSMNKEDLKNAIIERLNELKVNQLEISLFFELNWTDADGPREGGLDDNSDLISLYTGIVLSGGLLFILSNKYHERSETILDSIGWLLVYGGYSVLILSYFGEAFDVIETPPADGR